MQTRFHLAGNYAPIQDEVTLTELEIEGNIPPELSGVYVRNGPNPAKNPANHWFLGDGMLHGVHLKNGKAAWYKNRYNRTRILDGTPREITDRTMTSGNTSIVRHAGRLLALEEAGFPFEVTGELDSVGPFDFQGKLTTPCTAHPKFCPTTGEMHFFGYSFMPPFLTYHVADIAGNLTRSLEIPVKGPTMIHDFALTDKHVIFMDLPIVFDMDLAMSGEFPYSWSDSYGARFGVMPRGANVSELRWFEINPCYVFHVANAFESNGEIILEGCRYPELWRKVSYEFAQSAKLHRWTINLAKGSVKEEGLDNIATEFPRIDPRRTGTAHRIVYLAGASTPFTIEDPLPLDQVIRYDRSTGKTTSQTFSNSIVSEFSFIEGGKGEGEGWLMGYVFDKATQKSDLVILDATDLGVCGRIKLNRRVPQGFHGDWFAIS